MYTPPTPSSRIAAALVLVGCFIVTLFLIPAVSIYIWLEDRRERRA